MWLYSEINTFTRELAFLVMWLTRPTSLKLSNVERGQRLDRWPADTLHFGWNAVTLGIWVTGLLENTPSLFGSEKDVGPGQLGCPAGVHVLLQCTGVAL